MMPGLRHPMLVNPCPVLYKALGAIESGAGH